MIVAMSCAKYSGNELAICFEYIMLVFVGKNCVNKWVVIICDDFGNDFDNNFGDDVLFCVMASGDDLNIVLYIFELVLVIWLIKCLVVMLVICL